VQSHRNERPQENNYSPITNMLDIKFIRQNIDDIKKTAKNKGISFDADKLLEVDEKRRELITKSESIKAEQKKTEDRGKATALKAEFKELERQLEDIEIEYKKLMVQVPNIPSVDTPIGKTSEDNVEIYRWGEIPKFDFKPKNHIELGESLDIIDFEKGTKVAGFRGYYLKNEGALLVMALMQYAFQKMVEKGYKPFIPPTLVKEFTLFGSGYFKDAEYDPEVDEIYEVATPDKEISGQKSKEKKFLIGTAEPSLLAYYSDEILKEKDLPVKICGFSQCYRSEIGSYGKDTKGMYRVHEFMKVEQVIISKADIAESDELQQEMIEIVREMHQKMELPFRQIQICTGDMSAGKYKAFDTEAWLPGSNRWAETGSASNFTDWQARRLNIKYDDKHGERKYAFLLNNTALPSPRPLMAILENFQTENGTVKVPEILQKFMMGIKEIKNK
jgi:seryl-tRNA synthetase